jgi:hypothetical protein
VPKNQQRKVAVKNTMKQQYRLKMTKNMYPRMFHGTSFTHLRNKHANILFCGFIMFIAKSIKGEDGRGKGIHASFIEEVMVGQRNRMAERS